MGLHGFILLPTLPPIGLVIVITALNGIFMRVDVNDNFFENNVVFTMLFLKTKGGILFFSKYPAMCKRGLSLCSGGQPNR